MKINRFNENNALTITRREFIKQNGLVLTTLAFPLPLTNYFKNKQMKTNIYDIIIIGGSYSGLSAAMALGRAMKQVLIIDSGKPCNRQTPFSHNFLTQDGKTPKEIATLGRMQVEKYDTIAFSNGLATKGKKTNSGFEIEVLTGEIFIAKKLIFATGIEDILPNIKGFTDCWGISVLHCPYCHGYEVKNEKTGILANGESAFELIKLIYNWTTSITLYTNGISKFTVDQLEKLKKHKIIIEEREIDYLEHTNGKIQNIILKDGTKSSLSVVYVKNQFKQHCLIPEMLGCELTDEGYIKVDQFQETTVAGLFACGDSVSRMRTVSNSVAMGTSTGMILSKKMILEQF